MSLERIVRPNQIIQRPARPRSRTQKTAAIENDIHVVIGLGEVQKTKITGSASLSAAWYQIRRPEEQRG